jgi:hypothetical protein
MDDFPRLALTWSYHGQPAGFAVLDCRTSRTGLFFCLTLQAAIEIWKLANNQPIPTGGHE